MCEPASYAIVDCSTGECPGHTDPKPRRILIETHQIWLSPDADNERIEVCGSYAPDGGKARFTDAVFAFARSDPQ
ncbi:MAG: hypothetical protein GY798_26410 [Hyphomicrobiales bacterium]|nr:hypothetical protein [Hyphomicrobiales bacterium]